MDAYLLLEIYNLTMYPHDKHIHHHHPPTKGVNYYKGTKRNHNSDITWTKSIKM